MVTKARLPLRKDRDTTGKDAHLVLVFFWRVSILPLTRRCLLKIPIVRCIFSCSRQRWTDYLRRALHKIGMHRVSVLSLTFLDGDSSFHVFCYLLLSFDIFCHRAWSCVNPGILSAFCVLKWLMQTGSFNGFHYCNIMPFRCPYWIDHEEEIIQSRIAITNLT